MQRSMCGSRIAAVVSLLAVATVGAAVAQGRQNGVQLTPASQGCDAASWSPETITFFGDKQTVTGKVERLRADLESRRLFIVVVESEAGAEVVLYERAGKDRATVTRWRVESADSAHAAVRSAILKNKGVNCVGEQSRQALGSALGEPTSPVTEAAAPASLKATTEHPMKAMREDYVGVSVYLMC